MQSIRHLVEMARSAALDAGKIIMDVYQSGVFETTMKNGEGPLTKADRLSHAIITSQLLPSGLPVLSEEGRHIDFGERSSWNYFWLVDPLDGTKEFIHKNGEFTVNIALVWRDTPVAGIIYAPCTNTLYSGSGETGIWKQENGKQTEFNPLPVRRQLQDIINKEKINVVASRSHMSAETGAFIHQLPHCSLTSMGSSLKFMLLLENKADIYPRFEQTMEWDTAAAHAILKVSNRGIYHTDTKSELFYNKRDLTNPSFIAF